MMKTLSDCIKHFDGLTGYFRAYAVTFNYNNVFSYRIQMGEGFIFKLSNFFLHTQQVIYIVITFDQTGFLIRADLKFFFNSFLSCPRKLISCLSRSTEMGVAGSLSTVSKISFRKSSDTVTGSRKLLRALFLKMSAKKLLTTTSKPKSLIAQAACSREEPQPKFLAAISILPL
jgi:hypothetical protein